MVEFPIIQLYGTEQRDYGIFIGKCYLYLRRFAFVIGSQATSPRDANPNNVIYWTNAAHIPCGYRYSGYMTLIMPYNGIYYYIEVRKCKLQNKTIVFESYNENNSTAILSIWFNKGSTTDVDKEDWEQLNSVSAGVVMSYKTKTYKFTETRNSRTGAIEIDFCKTCDGGKCQFCTNEDIPTRFFTRNKIGYGRNGTMYGVTSLIQFNFENRVNLWSDTNIRLYDYDREQTLFFMQDTITDPINVTEAVEIGQFKWQITDKYQPEILARCYIDCTGIDVEAWSNINPDVRIGCTVVIDDSMGGFIIGILEQFDDETSTATISNISSTWLANNLSKPNTISDTNITLSRLGSARLSWQSGLCNFQLAKKIKLTFNGQWYTDRVLDQLFMYYTNRSVSRYPTMLNAISGFNLQTILNACDTWTDEKLWEDRHVFVDAAARDSYFKIGANMEDLVKDLYCTVNSYLFQLADDAGWIDEANTWLPEHVFVDQAACDAYFLDPLHAAELVEGIEALIGSSLMYYHSGTWRNTFIDVYATDVGRDAYYDANPTMLVNNMDIVSGGQRMQYHSPVWNDLNRYVKGDNRMFFIAENVEFEFDYPWFKSPTYADDINFAHVSGSSTWYHYDITTARAFGSLVIDTGNAVLNSPDVQDLRMTLEIDMSITSTDINGNTCDFNKNNGITFIKTVTENAWRNNPKVYFE